MAANETMATEGVYDEAQEPEEVSFDFEVVIGRQEQTLRLDDYDANLRAKKPGVYFIRAKGTGRSEDRIIGESVNIEVTGGEGGGNRQQRRLAKKQGHANEPSRQIITANMQAAFIAKCVYQITDYCLPSREVATGKRVDRKYDESRGGDNENNRQLYEAMLNAESQGLRDLVELFLDAVAGRNEDGQADLEALKNVPRA